MMRPAAPEPPLRLGQAAPAVLQRALSARGLWLDLGLAVLRVRSEVPDATGGLQSVYRHFPLVDDAPWADLHAQLRPGDGLRRLWRPQARFWSDGQAPFEPFPADTALPLLEWGVNWLIGRRYNDRLLLHAGVVERDGHALVMPALPGSGKSTLTAALSLRGWRLLSDEFGAYRPDESRFGAVLKPVALKNASIDVIRRFAPDAELGPSFDKTRKGTVAHLAPSRDAVDRRHEPAWPGAVLLPRWQAGAATEWRPVEPSMTFAALAFNAFNHATLGLQGFQAAVSLVRQCPAWQLIYSDLDDAIGAIAARWPAIVAGAAARRAEAAERASAEAREAAAADRASSPA